MGFAEGFNAAFANGMHAIALGQELKQRKQDETIKQGLGKALSATPEQATPEAQIENDSQTEPAQTNPPSPSLQRQQINNGVKYLLEHGETDKAFQLQHQAIQAESEQRMQAAQDREQAYQQDLADITPELSWYQKNSAYLQQKKQHQQDLADYQTQLNSGANPQTLGMPPQAPTQPNLTYADSLKDAALMLSVAAKHGKADPGQILALGKAAQMVNDEGYAKALNVAQAGAPIDQVLAEFNKTGQMQAQPEQVISDNVSQTPSGLPTRVITLKGEDGKVHHIDTLAELQALGQADKLIKNNLDMQKAKADIAQSNASAAASNASAANHQAQTEQNRLELEYMKTHGVKMGAQGGGESGVETKFVPNTLGGGTLLQTDKRTGQTVSTGYDDKGRPVNKTVAAGLKEQLQGGGERETRRARVKDIVAKAIAEGDQAGAERVIERARVNGDW